MKALSALSRSIRRQFAQSTREEKILAGTMVTASVVAGGIMLYVATEQYKCAAEKPATAEQAERCAQRHIVMKGFAHSFPPLIPQRAP